MPKMDYGKLLGRIKERGETQLEKDWNSPEKTMARALQFANDTITHLTAHIEADAPKVLLAVNRTLMNSPKVKAAI